jgi:DUF1680 family protein
VDAVRGCVALARGPVVYAIEDADLPAGVVLEDLRLLQVSGVGPGDVAPTVNLVAAAETPPTTALYTDLPAVPGIPELSEPFQIGIGPYHRWANRTPGAMRIWIPSAPPQYRTYRFREETP